MVDFMKFIGDEHAKLVLRSTQMFLGFASEDWPDWESLCEKVIHNAG